MEWKDSDETTDLNNEQETDSFEEEDYSPLKTGKVSLGAAVASILNRPIAYILIVAVVLILLIVIFVPNGSDGHRIAAMEQRLLQLESRMASLEGIGDLVASLDKNIRDTQPLMVRLDRLETDMAKKLSDIEKKVRRLSTKGTGSPARKAKKASKKEASSKPSASHHIVNKGETLYSISKKYGLSVPQLIKMNKLPANASIYPGQKLIVKP